MKIAHIITRLIIGGAQENTIFTVEGLIKKGHSVTLISGPTKGPEGSLVEEIRRKGIEVITVKELVREIHPLPDIIAFGKLLILLKKEKYDVVHTHSAKAGILGRIAAKISNRHCLVIHTVHGLSFHPYQSSILNFLYVSVEKFAEKFTNHFICVGEVMKQQCLQAGIGKKKKYSVIYSGFDTYLYVEGEKKREDTRRNLGIKEGEKVIGMVGRLFHLKGQNYLLKAFSELTEEFPFAKLLLVGDGILRQQLEDYARKKGIYERVVFTGLVPPVEIPEYVSAMDILAHTSLREGLPKTIAQGFAGGKPVVAFDVDGARELVINGKTGFLIPPKNISLLTEKLIFLLKNPEIACKMGEEGRKLVEKLFPVDKMTDAIASLYTRLKGESS